MIIEYQNIMRIREIIVESADLPSVTVAKANINRILAATQQVYDDWDESDRDTYAGGGICHIIADAISDVLWKLNIEATPVSCSYEQHVYVAAKFEEGVYTIDIPYHIYETGGGFSWKKIPDIQFDARDVVFYRVTSDPSEFDNYVGEDIEYVVEKRRRKKRSRSRGAAYGPGPYGVYGYYAGYSGEGVAEGEEEHNIINVYANSIEACYWDAVAGDDVTDCITDKLITDYHDVIGASNNPLLKKVHSSLADAVDVEPEEQQIILSNAIKKLRGNNYKPTPPRPLTADEKEQVNQMFSRFATGMIIHSMQQPRDGQGVAENFADGKKPGRKGLTKRVGVNCKQSVSKLRSIAGKSSGERQRMAHWCANMKSGKRK